MATTITKNVPANIGTAPKDPSAAVWPSLIGIKGYHSVLNKNSNIDTSAKKRRLSNISEKTIPIVVKIATDEQNISIYCIYLSIVCWAWNSGFNFCEAYKAPSNIIMIIEV